MRIRVRVALALSFVVGVAGLAAPSSAQAVANMGDAQTLACDYTITNEAHNNGWNALATASERVWVDHRMQVSTAPGCNPRVRGAVNFRCYKLDGGAWRTANCGSLGRMSHVQNDQLVTSSVLGYDFGSTGPDGTTSVYSAWTLRTNCRWYWSSLFVHRVTVEGNTYTLNEEIGASHDYLSPCPV
ncbi:hypothetical protein [Tenggerimyces flavus]|uniref:Secreted protein n=1 Tax=Tenggerimyces flavus TaxID=1708749 RepID=A0ABV7YBM8_9ACTN|nr:hypothetical protein [Tenggerimyces flavus]MBM7788897.1 outer membrane receptor for Fe3+-dicitrate [Tenggerimyces flavus]